MVVKVQKIPRINLITEKESIILLVEGEMLDDAKRNI